MQLLYIHQFFAGPEAPGPAQPRELVRLLAERGHHVDVLACDFNAYSEQTEPEEVLETSSGGRVQVHRIPALRNIRKSLRHRLQSYTGFAWNACHRARTMPSADMVLTTIQPLFSGYAGLKAARRMRVPFMLEVRDLWPDALVAKKVLSPWKAWPLERLARSLYFGADRVAVLTPGLKTELLKKGVPPDRLDLFPNGIKDAGRRCPDHVRDEIRDQYGWGDSFVAVYTGTHTEVTAVDTFVRAAARLRDRTDIRLDLFGTGQSKPAAMALAEALSLTNIHFHDPVPKSSIPAILSGADAALMSVFKSPLVHIYFENKLSDYMGAARPILGAMDGMQPQLIEREQAGKCASGLDDAGLAEHIRFAADHPECCRTWGENGFRFVCRHLAQETILNQYADTLEAVQAGRSAELSAWDPLGLS